MNHICVTYHSDDAEAATEVGNVITHHLQLDVQMIGLAPDGDQDWMSRLDEAIQESVAVVSILSLKALTARHVTFSWFIAQQIRRPVVSVVTERLPQHFVSDEIRMIDFVDDEPIEQLIAVVWDAAFSTLLVRLWDGDKEVRLRAIESLGEMGDVRASWPLTERLRDPDPEVCIAAIEVLATLRDERCIPTLLLLMNGENREVAAAARGALLTYPEEKTGLDADR